MSSTQPLKIDGRDPKSKKEVKEAVKADPSRVRLVAVAYNGGDYDGPLSKAPEGMYFFVGPHEYKRNWFGNITITNGKIVVK